MRLSPLLLKTLLFLLGISETSALRTPANSVPLSKIKTLTLRQNALTTSRRSTPIPQLQCVGGNGKGLYEVDVMRCENSGSEYDDDDVQWTCKASLPPEFKLGSTDVSCEGYSSAQDPYVLKGSCGVEYRLVLTEAGEKKYGYRDDDGRGPASSGEKLIFWAFFTFVAGMICWGVYDTCVRGNNRRPPHANRGYGGGGGWGGDDDDNNDPPPPYTPQPGKSSQNYGTNQGTQPWRPGFWTGTAAGAAAGAAGSYFAGNRNSTRAGSLRSTRSWGSTGSGRSSPAPSSSRYESTGFGSSSRR